MSALRREDATVDSIPDAPRRATEPPAKAELRERVKEADEAHQDRKERKAQTLDARIRQTEERIAGRRIELAARVSVVNGAVRSRVSSPLLIVVAAGAGFLFAQFHRHRDRDDRAERKRRDARPEVVMKPSIFASLTDALTLATTLLAMMPLIRSKAKEGVQEATGDVPPS